MQKIVFIGCGNMGGSLIGGLIANGYSSADLTGIEPDDGRRLKIATEFNIQTHAEINNAVNEASVIVLAVKPQMLHTALTALRNALKDALPLIISVVAGIRTEAITGWLNTHFPVIRVMPNTPSLIQSGVAAIYANENTTAVQQKVAAQIMQAVGVSIWLDDEALLDAVTAVSGSGPAYFFLIVELLEKIAVEMGLEPEHARVLTVETALGAVFHENGLEQLLRDALKACHQRSVELAEQGR